MNQDQPRCDLRPTPENPADAWEASAAVSRRIGQIACQHQASAGGAVGRNTRGAQQRKPGTRRSLALFARMVALLWVWTWNDNIARAQPSAREYDVKATLLFHFSQFVEWPPAAMSNTNAPFVIGILGTDPFGEFLDQLVKNERAHGKPVVIRRFRKVEEALGANILFVSDSERSRLYSVLSRVRGRPILTVGETAEHRFIEAGGIVAFVTASDNIRIRINLDEARSAGLTVSAKLLQLAEVVRRNED